MATMKTKRVLVIDDDEDILDIIRIILEDEGYQVTTLNNGTKVSENITASRPDLILLDVMLGGMDGREICKDLKSNALFNLIPIIMISASHNLQEQVLQPRFANAFIPKPFDIDNLVNVVNAQLITQSHHTSR
jgi:DNA-binding response OmpR family regulator